MQSARFLVSFLGHLRSAAFLVGSVALLSSCQPPEIPVEPGDNTLCHFEGYDQISVAGYLRIGFDYAGGEVLVTKGGLPLPLYCVVTP